MRVEDGTVAEARIAVGSVGARPVRAASAEEALVGKSSADAGVLAEAAALAAEAANAVEDANGSAEYKQQLVRVLVERCFRDAADASYGRSRSSRSRAYMTPSTHSPWRRYAFLFTPSRTKPTRSAWRIARSLKP